MTPAHRSARALLAAAGSLALLIALTGCNGATIFGRPQTYTDLAANVTDAFTHDRPDILESMVITNADRRKMNEEAEGDQDAHYAPAETAVMDSYSKVRAAGGDAGILWSEAQMTSAIADGAHNKYKEMVDVKVNLDSRGNHYQFLIHNAQLVDNGDVVLTDRIEWLGERK